jgi:hypothetical protein
LKAEPALGPDLDRVVVVDGPDEERPVRGGAVDRARVAVLAEAGLPMTWSAASASRTPMSSIAFWRRRV